MEQGRHFRLASPTFQGYATSRDRTARAAHVVSLLQATGVNGVEGWLEPHSHIDTSGDCPRQPVGAEAIAI